MNNDKNGKSHGFLHLFDGVVSNQGDAIAVTFGERHMTYTELAKEARRFTEALRSNGIEAGSNVAISVTRGPALLPLLLAVWSLRAAYVPVDPSYPAPRKAYILKNAGARLLICDAKDSDSLKDYEGRRLYVDAILQRETPKGSNLALAPQDFVPEDLAYVIYTSGSTGNPKGVAITHDNVVNFIQGMSERPGMSSSDRLLAVTTISFDIHVLELYLPLTHGARVILASLAEAKSQHGLIALIEKWQVTVMQATPATWRMVLANDWLPTHKLKILVGGEALPQDLRPAMHKASLELWNMYGPTETTVWSTCQLVHPSDQKSLIGSPILNTDIIVVDEQLKEVARGQPGELLIGGRGVAVGYFNNLELTNEKFIHLLSGGERYYRTGDCVVLHTDGRLEYKSRIDGQIKIRGYRIEPGDIEKCIEAHEGVVQAIVVIAHINADDVRLIAYFLGDASRVGELQNHCAASLPNHMIPQHFICIPQLPMTANLKVDRRALAEQAPQDIQRGHLISFFDCRDDLDISMARVFEKYLGKTGVSIDDNFFHIGGHSLLALQIVKDLKTATGLPFSDVLLFEAPSIRSMRECLSDHVGQAASVVKLNDVESDEPIFCLCGVGIYQELATQFAASQPVFGVFAKKEIAFIDAQKNHTKIEFNFSSLVKTYVEAIKRQGEYKSITLLGLSFGGLVALEVAKVFRQEGINVSDVILLDTYLKDSSYRSVRQTCKDYLQALQRQGMRDVILRSVQKLTKKIRHKQSKALKYFSLQEAENQREKAFENATNQFLKSEHKYQLDALLIKAVDTNFGFGRRPRADYGLSKLISGELVVKSMVADHVSMLKVEKASEVYRLIHQYQLSRRQPNL